MIKGSILDYEKMKEAARGSNYIVHAAAVVGVQNVLRNSHKTIETNFIGTANVFRAAEEQPDLKRAVYFSTSEVFGINAFQVDEEAHTVFGSNKEPRWSYSISKIAGEHLVQSYNRENALPTVVIRPFNVFGPRRIGEHVIRIFMLKALRGETITVHNDGSQIRAWCYIDDMTQALMAALSRKSAIGEAFNIGNPQNSVNVYQLAVKIRDICKSKSKIVTRPINFPDIELRVPDIRKAAKLLGYKPEFEIDRALEITRDWYKKYLI